MAAAGPEEEAMISQLQEEEKGLSTMWADNQRNLQQAREAVAASKRDRGWQGSSQGGKSKSTTTFVKGKGKGKPKGKSNFPSYSSSPPNHSNAMWAFPKGFSKGKSKLSKGSNFHGPQSKNGWYLDSFESGMLSLETEEEPVIDEEINMAMPGSSKAPLSHRVASSSVEAGGTRGVVDTGATVTAGGHEAVQNLITGLAKVRPDLKVTLVEGDRPYFRYGSGRWGRALFKAIFTPIRECSCFGWYERVGSNRSYLALSHSKSYHIRSTKTVEGKFQGTCIVQFCRRFSGITCNFSQTCSFPRRFTAKSFTDWYA